MNVGRRASAQLTLTTGLEQRQAPTRATNAASTPAPSPLCSTRVSVRFGSAFETTARARTRSPPASRTPVPGSIAATSHAAGEDGAGGARGIGQAERDPAHPPFHVPPPAEEPEPVVRVHPGRPLVAGPGERADDPLAVQRSAEPLVGHVPLDDVGDRCVQDDFERLVVVGEQLVERTAVGRVADPGVAERPAPQAFADPVEQRVVREEAVDVAR